MLANIPNRPQPFVSFPSFFQNKVDAYYERLLKNWGGKHIIHHGKTPDQNSILLVSNDYLSLANHPKILQAQIQTLEEQGNGLMMSSIFIREEHPQRTLEHAFAKYTNVGDALLCQSGFSANVGLLQSIANEETPIYIDIQAHMSLWEGIKSAQTSPKVFKHNDVEHLEKQIQKYGSGIIAVDSVYSVTGSIAPLQEIARVSENYGCLLVVDESHSLGTHGKNGAGLVIETGIEDQVHFRTASLAKAFCGRGGIILGDARAIECIRYESNPAIFSSGVLLPEVAGFQATLQIIQEADERREHLHSKSQYLREGLQKLGYNLNQSQSQIISLESGLESQTMILKEALEERGIFGSAFCSPATSKKRSTMRFSLNSTISQEQLDYLLLVCAEIQEKVGFTQWKSTKRLKKWE